MSETENKAVTMRRAASGLSASAQRPRSIGRCKFSHSTTLVHVLVAWHDERAVLRQTSWQARGDPTGHNVKPRSHCFSLSIRGGGNQPRSRYSGTYASLRVKRTSMPPARPPGRANAVTHNLPPAPIVQTVRASALYLDAEVCLSLLASVYFLNKCTFSRMTRMRAPQRTAGTGRPACTFVS